MNLVLIKFKYRYDDIEETVGIAASQEIADSFCKDLASKYPLCYGPDHGHWYFENFKLIEG